jgi:hypothetical protein
MVQPLVLMVVPALIVSAPPPPMLNVPAPEIGP